MVGRRTLPETVVEEKTNDRPQPIAIKHTDRAEPMTTKEASRLRVGDRVSTDSFPPDEHHTGEVIEVGYNAVKIEWDDRAIGIIHHADMEEFDHVPQG